MSGGEQLDYMVATYREIAARFGLKGADQGRMKAKRAGWQIEPVNHPADPRRVRVPREVWDAGEQVHERGGSRAAQSAPLRTQRNGQSLDEALGALKEQLERERERGERAEAALAAKTQELAEVREDRARLAGEVDGLKTAAEHLHEVAAQARREAAESQLRATEAEQAAARARGEKQALEATLAQFRARGLLARLLNR